MERPWAGGAPDGEDRVMVLTAERIPLEVRPVESELVSDGQVCLGTHFKNRLLARSEVEKDDAGLVLELLRVPAQVGLLAEEENQGVQGSLVALLPHGEVHDILRSAELEDEPWKASLSAPEYESDLRSDQPVMVPLGSVVRIPEKRISPDNLQAEAEDMLRSIMTRGGQEVVDQILDSL